MVLNCTQNEISKPIGPDSPDLSTTSCLMQAEGMNPLDDGRNFSPGSRQMAKLQDGEKYYRKV